MLLIPILVQFTALLRASNLTPVLHQLDPKIIYLHCDFKHLTEKYFEIGMNLDNFPIQLVKYCHSLKIKP